MVKRGSALPEYLLAILLVVVVVVVIISYGPKIWELIMSAIGLRTIDKSKISTEMPSTITERGIKGEFGSFSISKREDLGSAEQIKSPGYCLVVTSVTNTGANVWTPSDKVRTSLFCKYNKDQNEGSIFLNNYPPKNYITDLKSGENKNIYYTINELPYDCLNFFDKYEIILYSNCDEEGTIDKPCSNLGNNNNPPKISAKTQFVCETS